MPYPINLKDYSQKIQDVITQKDGWKPKDTVGLKTELARTCAEPPTPRTKVTKYKK